MLQDFLALVMCSFCLLLVSILWSGSPTKFSAKPPQRQNHKLWLQGCYLLKLTVICLLSSCIQFLAVHVFGSHLWTQGAVRFCCVLHGLQLESQRFKKSPQASLAAVWKHVRLKNPRADVILIISKRRGILVNFL
jgi:hypothetical protein